MNCVQCNNFCRTIGSVHACVCIRNKPIHACCVERMVNVAGRCNTCSTLLYREAGTWTDCVTLWEEALWLHFRAACIDFLWMVFMYVGYNVPWALPGWGLYYIVQTRGLSKVKSTSWRFLRLAWILMFPVLNGLLIDSAAPRWASYPRMEGSAIIADLLPLFFYSLCIERGKQALIWQMLPRRMVLEKIEKRAFLCVACAWWDSQKWIAVLFGLGWALYVLHVLFVRNAIYNFFLLPFWIGAVLLAANVARPRRMPFVK